MEESPQRLGPYQVRSKIGAGGMGVVYLGWDSRLNRHVALKTLWPELARDVQCRARFLQEARSAAALSHPNVTQIYDIGEEKGKVYFAMEYLAGEPLDKILENEGSLPPERALAMTRQAAAGLQAAAAQDIIHRDIKPSNFLVANDGTLKITDFGLAKRALSDAGLTTTGQLIGTPYYLSPELASGKQADLRSDIYSLGATLFQMLTGRPPFQGPTSVSIVLKHVNEPPPLLKEINPDLPAPLSRLVQRMLAKDPEDRPHSYDALLKELDRVATGASPGATLAATGVSVVPAVPPAGRGAGGTTAAGQPRHAAAHFQITEEQPSGSSAGKLLAVIAAVLALAVGWYVLENGVFLPMAPLQTIQERGGAVTPGTSGSSGTSQGTGGGETAAGASSPSLLERLGQGGRANLEFVEKLSEVTEDGHLRVSGDVINTGHKRAGGGSVRVILTDDDSKIVGSKEVSITPSVLEPGETGTFEALFSNPGRSVHIQLELNWVS